MTHGKAVFNNKEIGFHLLAKPNGSYVHATSLKTPNHSPKLEAAMF